MSSSHILTGLLRWGRQILTGGVCADRHVASGNAVGRGRQADRAVGHCLDLDSGMPPREEMYIADSFTYRNAQCNQCFDPELLQPPLVRLRRSLQLPLPGFNRSVTLEQLTRGRALDANTSCVCPGSAVRRALAIATVGRSSLREVRGDVWSLARLRACASRRLPYLSSAVDYILGLADTMMDDVAKQHLKRSVGTSAGAEIRAWVNRYASSVSRHGPSSTGADPRQF